LVSPEQAALVGRLQESVPPGAPILAVISTPFRLDFRRNPIYDATFAGIHAPWAHIPPVEYVIWDYAGDASPVRNLCRAHRRRAREARASLDWQSF
jgi:hypothetical protein